MQLLRRFLVFQALLLWQGGFLFYAAVVIPVGSDVLGSWSQGMVTRHVTDRMNLIGAAAMLILAWDQLANAESNCRRCRWVLWTVMAVCLVGLVVLHPSIAAYVDGTGSESARDYRTFYSWHRLYLYVATAQWVAGLGYTVVTLRAWTAKPAIAS
jgi:hypothetical protein